ncbi:unnamed protein product [Rotaria socialis]|uniref:Uncharacterized protein n=3 Tax=Rotaria socialis TaxID=392032 RepID=A0A820PLR9_9BILA|nr:unnamed protein product [Rotaria socialis]CAF4405153.1 unnamed protein product [Rotaria socialis]
MCRLFLIQSLEQLPMPRIYKRKTEDNLKAALSLIENQKISVKTAASLYNIPSRTIFHRLARSRTGAKRGRKTILCKEEESHLVDTILLFPKWQRPISPSVVMRLAKPYMLQLGKAVSLKSTLRDWFYGFMRRWSKEIKLAKSGKLEKARSEACRKETVESWFKHLKEVLTKHKLFDRPEALWNADERGFSDDPSQRSVIIKRDSKWTISSQSGTGKSYTTLIMCTSASGEKPPPYIIYRGVKLWSTWVPKNGFPGARYNVTLSGWVEEEVFYDWLVHQFSPAVQHLKRPLMLFFDGHRAHISARIVKTAMDNGIELECLPPHTTTLLQPLDVVTLSKVKTAWRSILVEHNTKTNSAPIQKPKFSLLIYERWKNHLLKGHCSAGFAKAGIYPYEPRAVSNEKLLGPSPSITSNDGLIASNDSVVINRRTHQLIRSTSCDQLSTSALSLTTTPLHSTRCISNVNSLSPITTTVSHIPHIETSSMASVITAASSTISSTMDGTTTTVSSSAHDSSNCDLLSSDVPVFTDLTNQTVRMINNSL